MSFKATASIGKPQLRNGETQSEIFITYEPTAFELSGAYMSVNLADTYATTIDRAQQFAMDIINAETSGAIATKSDILVHAPFAK